MAMVVGSRRRAGSLSKAKNAMTDFGRQLRDETMRRLKSPALSSPKPMMRANVKHHVQLLVTPFGPAMPTSGLQGYHTSVLIDDTEYTFSGNGVTTANGPMSHVPHRAGGKSTVSQDYGQWEFDLRAFEAIMSREFGPGTYDLLRKNCNSFSECAIFYITGRHTDSKLRSLEGLAQTADRYTSVLQVLAGYRPNPRAEDFDVERAAMNVRVQRC
mmetsp:Transcript_49563/g.144076  ORF Transcript_49563/g.144076 Transcript_49563/m.144076 type:complete len:214 (-) Transcript_49563:285-926(-)